MTIDSKELMNQFKSGSVESFEKLVLHHRHNAVNFALKFLNDYYLAEDIVQESFADIYVYKERYNDKYSFKTYLYTIIRNKAVDYIRKNSKDKVILSFNNNIQSAEDCYLEIERNLQLMAGLSNLKEDHLIVLYLSKYENLKYQEIAKIMGKSITYIKVLVYRAKKELKKICEEAK